MSMSVLAERKAKTAQNIRCRHDWLWFLGIAIAWGRRRYCVMEGPRLVQVGATIINPDRIDFAERHCRLEIIRRRSACFR
jgi:hypothetical protein